MILNFTMMFYYGCEAILLFLII